MPRIIDLRSIRNSCRSRTLSRVSWHTRDRISINDRSTRVLCSVCVHLSPSIIALPLLMHILFIYIYTHVYAYKLNSTRLKHSIHTRFQSVTVSTAEKHKSTSHRFLHRKYCELYPFISQWLMTFLINAEKHLPRAVSTIGTIAIIFFLYIIN